MCSDPLCTEINGATEGNVEQIRGQDILNNRDLFDSQLLIRIQNFLTSLYRRTNFLERSWTYGRNFLITGTWSKDSGSGRSRLTKQKERNRDCSVCRCETWKFSSRIERNETKKKKERKKNERGNIPPFLVSFE